MMLYPQINSAFCTLSLLWYNSTNSWGTLSKKSVCRDFQSPLQLNCPIALYKQLKDWSSAFAPSFLFHYVSKDCYKMNYEQQRKSHLCVTRYRNFWDIIYFYFLFKYSKWFWYLLNQLRWIGFVSKEDKSKVSFWFCSGFFL